MFHQLKIYTVHIKSGSNYQLERPLFLREGFNWGAFMFTFLWAFYHRLWAFGILVLAANVVIGACAAEGIITPVASGLTQFAFQILIGFNANDALRIRLAKRGFVMSDITSGDSLLRAEQRYFDRLVATLT
jgi:hypothetical protein